MLGKGVSHEGGRAGPDSLLLWPQGAKSITETTHLEREREREREREGENEQF